MGICGAPFRDCYDSTSRSGVHNYVPVYSKSNGKKYMSGYQAKEYEHSVNIPYTKTRHRGSTTPPTAKVDKLLVHGENGVGVDAVIPDETPSCDTCIDGSDRCPGCGSQDAGDSDDDETASTTPSSPQPTTPGLHHTTSPPFVWGLGETHKFKAIADSDYFEINWYLLEEGETGLGTWLYANSGGPNKTEGTLTYTFSSENSIESYTSYTLIARVERLSDGSNYNLTFEIDIGP